MIGSLSVDRTHNQALTQDDLDMLVTLASQVAIALDNAQGPIARSKPQRRPGSPGS